MLTSTLARVVSPFVNGRSSLSVVHRHSGTPQAGPSASFDLSAATNLPVPVTAPRPSAYRRKKNLICPQCRAPVHSAPFQLYAIKEATTHLRNAEQAAGPSRPPVSEPLVKHDPEAHRDEKDTSWGNLFLGSSALRHPVVRDHEDGVRRCSRCAWEIAADGICEGW